MEEDSFLNGFTISRKIGSVTDLMKEKDSKSTQNIYIIFTKDVVSLNIRRKIKKNLSKVKKDIFLFRKALCCVATLKRSDPVKEITGPHTQQLPRNIVQNIKICVIVRLVIIPVRQH